MYIYIRQIDGPKRRPFVLKGRQNAWGVVVILGAFLDKINDLRKYVVNRNFQY